MYSSIKVFDGFSTCFRQPAAKPTNCALLHGYALTFEVVFTGELDHRNWVVSFGQFKSLEWLIDGMSIKQWLAYMFDHTVVLSEDDPLIPHFKEIEKLEGLALRILPQVGCEKFAKYVYDKLNDCVVMNTNGRCRVESVKCMEHGKNSSIYSSEN